MWCYYDETDIQERSTSFSLEAEQEDSRRNSNCLSLESQMPKHKENEVHWDTRFLVEENEWCSDGKCGWHVVSPGVGRQGNQCRIMCYLCNKRNSGMRRSLLTFPSLMYHCPTSFPWAPGGYTLNIPFAMSYSHSVTTFHECRFKMLKENWEIIFFPRSVDTGFYHAITFLVTLPSRWHLL